MFYKNHVPKPLLMTIILQLIAENADILNIGDKNLIVWNLRFILRIMILLLDMYVMSFFTQILRFYKVLVYLKVCLWYIFNKKYMKHLDKTMYDIIKILIKKILSSLLKW